MRTLLIILFVSVVHSSFSQSTLDRKWSAWKTDTIYSRNDDMQIEIVKKRVKGYNRVGYVEQFIRTSYNSTWKIQILNKGRLKSLGNEDRTKGLIIYYKQNGSIERREKYDSKVIESY